MTCSLTPNRLLIFRPRLAHRFRRSPLGSRAISPSAIRFEFPIPHRQHRRCANGLEFFRPVELFWFTLTASWRHVFPHGRLREWNNDEVREIARGLRKARDTSWELSNIVDKPFFCRLVDSVSISSETWRLFYASYLFLLRLPPDALPLIRSTKDGKLPDSDIHISKALVGLRKRDGLTFLLTHLCHRWNGREGGVMLRPCLCSGAIFLGPFFCPIRDSRRQAGKFTNHEDELAPKLRKSDINRTPKATLSSLEVTDSQRFHHHAFRRVAAKAILNAGGSLIGIMNAGGRPSISSRIYIPHGKSEDPALSRIFTAMYSSGSTPAESANDSTDSDTSAASSRPL